MGRRRAGRGRAFRGKAQARVRGDEERGCAAEHLDYARARRSAGGSLDFQIFVSARSNFFVHVVALFRLTFVTQERRFSDANRWNPPRHFLFWRPVALFLAPSCCRDAGGKSTSSRRRTRCRSAVKTLLETEPPPSPTAALFWTRAAGGVTAERREASAGLPSGGVETRARLVARRCAPAAGRARGRHGERGAVPDGVSGGTVGAERRGAARGGADADRGTSPARSRASVCVVVRSIRGGANAPGDRPERRVDRSAIPSFSHPRSPEWRAHIGTAFCKSFRNSPRRAGKLIGARAFPFSLLTRPSA